ncbi:protein of unknown function [Actinomadura meyerae]|jgi:hypothetical protein|uniref:DUF397 domain-containing protein n=1 Tax=Actinomadura meyerae TaxID=240840 RepID=A0A239KCV9_9ACTN|nr:DUF397 domain-containing protein [Actinomadura meyerae]SNT16177.1 protein of unknown function [Actinomadura meyerae]
MTSRFTNWRKSRYSEPNGTCVEVAAGPAGTVGIRDSKAQGAAPILELTRQEWVRLLESVRSI